MKQYFLLILVLSFGWTLLGQEINVNYKSNGWSGNPVFEGWYADPEAIIYGNEYWIFPTWSDQWGDYQAS